MLIVQPEAETDLRNARAWYEAQSSGLGDEFLAEIDRIFSLIEARPDAYAIVHRKARKASVRRFPYVVLYVERQGDLVVLGVLHHRRDPGTARARMR
jgi:plasmid stabilization system protein ParE